MRTKAPSFAPPSTIHRGLLLELELLLELPDLLGDLAALAVVRRNAPMPSSISKPSSSAAAAATDGCHTGPMRRALWRRPSGPLLDPGASRPGGRGWVSGEPLCRRASAMPGKG